MSSRLGCDEEDLAVDGSLIINADELPLPIRAIRFGSERDPTGPHIKNNDFSAFWAALERIK